MEGHRDYKPKVSAEDMKKRREETANTIRRSNRDESLQKRRQLTSLPPTGQTAVAEPFTEDFSAAAALAQQNELPVMVQGVNSNDVALQLEMTTRFRKLLSKGMRVRLGARARAHAHPVRVLSPRQETVLAWPAPCACRGRARPADCGRHPVRRCAALRALPAVSGRAPTV